MEKVDVVINSLWYVFGVGATLFVGLGIVIRWLLKERKEDKEDAKELKADSKEMQIATIEAVKEVTKAITSLEIVIKTMK